MMSNGKLRFVSVVGLVLCMSLMTRGADTKLYCELTWVEMSSGTQVPELAVRSQQGPGIFVARTSKDSQSLLVGHMNTDKNGRAYFALEDEELQEVTYDLLVNEYECTLVWVRPIHGDVGSFAVKPDSSDPGKLIGRAEIEDAKLISGTVQNGRLTISDGEGNVTEYDSGSYYVLLSYSKGLEMELTNFIFEEDPAGGESDMAGLDEIVNESGAEIKQYVTHSKSVEETFYFSSTHSFTVASSWSLSASIGIGGFLGAGGSVGGSTSETTITETSITTTRIKELSLKREITVPSYESVQSCSTVNMKDGFKSRWTAEAKFRSPGKSARQVIEHVSTQSGWNGKEWVEQGNSAVTVITGEFEGTMALSNKFFVAPNREGEEGACVTLSKYLTAKKRNRLRKPNAPITREEREAYEIEEEAHIREIFLKTSAKAKPPHSPCLNKN